MPDAPNPVETPPPVATSIEHPPEFEEGAASVAVDPSPFAAPPVPLEDPLAEPVLAEPVLAVPLVPEAVPEVVVEPVVPVPLEPLVVVPEPLVPEDAPEVAEASNSPEVAPLVLVPLVLEPLVPAASLSIAPPSRDVIVMSAQWW
jgi:hypothetical protein